MNLHPDSTGSIFGALIVFLCKKEKIEILCRNYREMGVTFRAAAFSTRLA
jgi:hypothetical protein